MIPKLFSAAGAVLAWYWLFALLYPHEPPGLVWFGGALGLVWYVLIDEEKNS